MATVFISPTGAGKRDGSSAANAASIWAIDKMIDKAGPDGTVMLLADQGTYKVSSTLALTNGGSTGHPVTIKGVDKDGNAMNAEFVGSRAAEYSPTAAKGSDLFRLLGGADNLNFENMSIANVQNAFRVGADVANISIAHMKADNVQRFFEDYASTAAKVATISGLRIEDVDINGFSKGAIRLQYDTNNVVIKDVHGDSQHQDGDDFAIGIHLSGTVHNVLIKDTSMMNAQDTIHAYWNGDGFATERGVYGLRFEDTYSAGNTDGGYDLKSQDTVLLRAVAEDNNRNYRIWGDGVTIIDSVSLDPNHRGGIGGQAHVYLAPNSDVTIINSKLVDNSTKTVAFDLSENYARVTLVDTEVTINAAARLTKLAKGSGALNDDGTKIVAEAYDQAVADALRLSTGIDGANAAVVKLAPPSYVVAAEASSVLEGNSGLTMLQFTVSRDGDISKAGTVSYSVAGVGKNAADAADFANNVLPNGQVTFAAGEASKSIAVAITADTKFEANESFQFKLNAVDVGTIKVDAVDVTVVNDDAKPKVFTILDKAHSIDLSAAGNQTVTGSDAHNSFYVDLAAKSGKDIITNFGHDDVLLTNKAIFDGNKDGIITASATHAFAIDGTAAGDTLTLANGIDALRYLGKTSNDLFVYADADVRPKGAIESKVGNDVLSGKGNAAVPSIFFFDTGLDINLGNDAIIKFGANDAIVTTSKIETANGRITADASGKFALPGGTGDADDSYIPGEGGTVSIAGASGKLVTALEFDGSVVHNDVTYYVYTQAGSTFDVDHIAW